MPYIHAFSSGGHHETNFGADRSVPENEFIDGSASPAGGDLFGGTVHEGLGWTDRGTHRLLADRSAVVAHIAFHHLINLGQVFGDSERAREDTVGASDAPGFERALHHSVRRSFDRIRGADGGAGRLVAVHADDWRRLHSIVAFDSLQMNHRNSGVSVAFRASSDTCIASNAPAGIDIELPLAQLILPRPLSTKKSSATLQ